MKSKSIFCWDCDQEITTTVESDQYGEWIDFPDTCPHCGEGLDTGCDGSEREDFHSDC